MPTASFLGRKPAIARVKVKDYLAAFTLEHLIEAGRQMERSFVLHVGPTNSGKTYQALQVLRKAEHGVYLGPLRLLALEVFDTLNADGFPCTLLTGEEWQPTEGAHITASTIEMADYGSWHDVAVIDECQMLRDPERGCHWLKAITTLPARGIHLCMAPESQTIVEDLLKKLGSPWTVQNHQRLAPLSWSGSFPNLKQVEPGDALIAFSRKGVLSIAAELETFGVKASVIYGALPPHSRREEVRRFKDGETTVVVATDAIGMGISLPIRRVIFCQSSKFDGTQVRGLRTHEILQIAGRAGRYGIYDEGFVLSMSEPKRIRRALDETPAQIQDVLLPFPEEALETKYKLGTMLRAWNKLEPEPGVRRTDMTNALALLGILEARLPKELLPGRKALYSLITCPVDHDNGPLVGYWFQCCQALLKGAPVPEPDFPEDTLEECELKYKALDVQHQMGRRAGVEIDNMPQKTALAEKINAFLRKSKDQFLRKCSNCGKILPPNTTYGMCQKCYDRMRSSRRSWWDDDYLDDEDFW